MTSSKERHFFPSINSIENTKWENTHFENSLWCEITVSVLEAHPLKTCQWGTSGALRRLPGAVTLVPNNRKERTWSQQQRMSQAPAVKLQGQGPRGWYTWLGITVMFSEKKYKWQSSATKHSDKALPHFWPSKESWIAVLFTVLQITIPEYWTSKESPQMS